MEIDGNDRDRSSEMAVYFHWSVMLRKLVAVSNLIDHISISIFLFLFSTYETAKVQISSVTR